MTKTIAVIRSGISGLMSANLLSQRYKVSLFEANDYLGGHTQTLDLSLGEHPLSVDTGFIVFNKKTYPRFCKMLDQYQIPIEATEMSFSYRSLQSGLEYNGNNLNTIFADRRNLFKGSFYHLLYEICRFNHEAKRFALKPQAALSLQDFVKSRHFSQAFVRAYLLPLVASIWTKKVADVLDCPAAFLFEFFKSHDLLDIIDRPQWYVLKNGSNSYIPYLTQPFAERIYLNTKVLKLRREAEGVKLKTTDGEMKFDYAVVAVHSDQALEIVEAPTAAEISVLSAIQYSSNEALLHTDTSVLPKNPRAWASWNYLDLDSKLPTLTYNLNRLQNLRLAQTLCLSVNLNDRINPDKILKRLNYAHPCFNQEALLAQKRYDSINGQQRTYYCGAYWGFGFHEDGVKSAEALCRSLGLVL